MTGRRTDTITTILGPNLPRAACTGKSPQFDDYASDNEPHAHRVARHRQAIRICHTCPQITDCHTCPQITDCLAARLADPTLGPGIWAGQLFTPHKTQHNGPVKGLARCQNCETPINPKRRARGARNCNDRCQRAASRKRTREAAA